MAKLSVNLRVASLIAHKLMVHLTTHKLMDNFTA